MNRNPPAGPGFPGFKTWGAAGGSGLDHEAVLLAIVGHQDHVAVGGPDEASQLQVVLGARGGGLDRWDLVGLDAAELGGRVQHPDAAEETGVHLRGAEKIRITKIIRKIKQNDENKKKMIR